jgi:hypothetical protein
LSLLVSFHVTLAICGRPTSVSVSDFVSTALTSSCLCSF